MPGSQLNACPFQVLEPKLRLVLNGVVGVCLELSKVLQLQDSGALALSMVLHKPLRITHRGPGSPPRHFCFGLGAVQSAEITQPTSSQVCFLHPLFSPCSFPSLNSGMEQSLELLCPTVLSSGMISLAWLNIRYFLCCAGSSLSWRKGWQGTKTQMGLIKISQMNP